MKISGGSSVGIFGANGSGKSTLIKCITGLLPYDGEILIDGEDVFKKTSLLANVGILIEEPALYKDMTGRKNIEYLCSDTSNMTYYAEILGVADILDKKVRSYSLGMKQKMAILLACVKGKNLILLDEPFNGLDIISVDKAIELLNICRKKGATIMLTSHQLDVSQKAIDFYYLLKDTKIYDCTAPQPMGGKRYQIDFFDKDSASSAYKILQENGYQCSLQDFSIKIIGEDMKIIQIANCIRDFNIKRIEDISYSVKEAYLEMEAEK
ncbi:MAG: ABC transporter ATP-binding protein [Clostridiales bacterium]|nr:ABC transporter ATP-binding protein [Clostridiales bacterium]